MNTPRRHYFASTIYKWAVGATVEEALANLDQKLPGKLRQRDIAYSLPIKVRVNRVECGIDEAYEIDEGMVVGTPITERQIYFLVGRRNNKPMWEKRQ